MSDDAGREPDVVVVIAGHRSGDVWTAALEARRLIDDNVGEGNEKIPAEFARAACELLSSSSTRLGWEKIAQEAVGVSLSLLRKAVTR